MVTNAEPMPERIHFDPAWAEPLRVYLETRLPDGRTNSERNADRWLLYCQARGRNPMQVYLDQAALELPEAGRILAGQLISTPGIRRSAALWLTEAMASRASISTILLMICRPGDGLTTALCLAGLASAMGGADVRYQAHYSSEWLASARAVDVARCNVLLLDEVQRVADQSAETQVAVRALLAERAHSKGVTVLGVTGEVADFVRAFNLKTYNWIPERHRYIAPGSARREP